MEYGGDDYFLTSSGTLSYVIEKAGQPAISLESVADDTAVCGHAPFTLSILGGAGIGPVTYEITEGDAITIIGQTATIIHAGTVTIRITKSGDSNYKEQTATAELTISKASPVIAAAPSAADIVLGARLSTSALTGGTADVAGTFQWTHPDTIVTEAGTYEATFIPDDTASYKPVTCNVAVAAQPARFNAKIEIATNAFTSFLNSITFGLFFKETVQVTITGDVGTGGTIEYQIAEAASGYNPDNSAWIPYTSLSVDPNRKFIVYARLSDSAGNYTIITSQGVVMDHDAPSVSLVPSATGWSASNVDVAVSASDSLSGLVSVTYTTDEAVPQEGTVTLAGGEGSITLHNEGQYTLTVTATDSAGNVTTKTAVIKIDKTAPSIDVTGNPSAPVQSASLTISATAGCSGKTVTVSKDGGTAESVSGSSYTVTANGDYVFKIENGLGTIAEKTVKVAWIDRGKPVVNIDSHEYSDGEWSASDVSLTIANAAENLGTTVLEYSLNGSAFAPFAGSVKVDADGDYAYSFRATSESGVVSDTVDFRVKVDKTAPTDAVIRVEDLEFRTLRSDYTFDIFYSETVDVSIAAEFGLSGQKKIEYQKVAKAADYNAAGTWTEGSSFSVSSDEAFIVFARVTDNAGNSVIVSTNGIVKDAGDPSLILTGTDAWKAENVSVEADVGDTTAGIATVTYTTDETVPQAGTVSLTSGKGSITLSNTGDYVLIVTAVDKAGNHTTKTQRIRIDKDLPTIDVSGNPTSPVQSAALTVSAGAGISGKSVTVSKDGGTETPVSGTEYLVTANGSYQFTVTNGAGVSAKKTVKVEKIDREKPVVAIDSHGYTGGNWTSQSVTLTVSNSTANLGTTVLEYSLNNGGYTVFDGTIEVTADRDGSYRFRATSESGVISDVADFSVKVDKTAPTNPSITVEESVFRSLISTITFGLFFKETVGVSIAADCGLSGQKKIEYQKVVKASDYSAAGTWTEGSSFSVSADGAFIVYARITDNAGNFVIISTDGIILDGTDPLLTLKGPVSWKTEDTTIEVDTSDALAGLESVTYTTNEAIPQTGTVSLTAGKGSITLTANGEYTLIVTATDKAGNQTQKTLAIQIDKVLPTLDVTGNPAIPSASAVLSIAATAGVSGKTVTVSKDGGPETTLTDMDFTVTENGGYEFTVTNGAGVSVRKTVAVAKIDRVKPMIAVDSHGYVSGSWTTADVTLHISNTGANLGDTLFEYSLNGGDFTAFNGDLTVSSDGVEAYRFRATSESGMVSDIADFMIWLDKTAPLDTAISFVQKPASSILHFLTFGLFFGRSVDVAITGSDPASGIDRFEYQIVPESSAFDPKASWTSGASLVVAPYFKGSVYARAVDKAGNQSAAVVKSFIADNTAPVIQASYQYDNIADYKGDAAISVTVADKGAGIARISYQIGQAAVKTADLTTTDYSDRTGSYSFEIGSLPYGNYTVVIQAVDNSGNAADSKSITVKKSSVNSVWISPAAAAVVLGQTRQFAATVEGQNNPDPSVTWSVAGNTSADTRIDTAGNLTAASDETAGTLTVTAVSAVDSGKSVSVQVTAIHPVISDEDAGIALDLTDTTLPENVTEVTIKVAEMTQIDSAAESSVFIAVQDLLQSSESYAGTGSTFVYNLELLDQDGKPVTGFTGKIKVKIPIPAGMSGNPHVLWYDPSTGALVDMNAVVENGYLVFETTHFSYYVVAQLAEKAADEELPSAVWFVVAAAAALAACLALLAVFRKKRRNLSK